jgi:hypothetical protein
MLLAWSTASSQRSLRTGTLTVTVRLGHWYRPLHRNGPLDRADLDRLSDHWLVSRLLHPYAKKEDAYRPTEDGTDLGDALQLRATSTPPLNAESCSSILAGLKLLGTS